jgi:predicted metal-dependent hydrolase
MTEELTLGEVRIAVEFKAIKNVHLSVYPPDGQVRIAAPERMKLDTLRAYAISKLGWIRQQQRRFLAQPRETPREYVERESHYLWGERYLLKVVEREAPNRVVLGHREIRLEVRVGTATHRRQALLEAWQRAQLREAAAPLVARWERVMGVKVARVHVQRMKTRWGSCSPARGSIRLNAELVKKPRELLEYVVVHEMAHLLEPTHNGRFVALMDRWMPGWRLRRMEVNNRSS